MNTFCHKLPAAMIAFVLLAPLAVSARPTQSEVFKSIQDNVSESDGSNARLIPWACGAAGVIVVVCWFGRRQTLQATPKPLNNPHRLSKEILKLTSLKPSEFKQVRLLTEEIRAKDDKPVCSPLVLLLCPSMLARAVADPATRADRRTLAHLVKKLESR
jgi:hypothetical protein